MQENLSNEDKLNEIYRILVRQESHRKWGVRFRLLKWLLLLGIAFFVVVYPGWILGKVTNFLTPIIMENVKDAMQDEKNGFIEKIKTIIPSNPSPLKNNNL